MWICSQGAKEKDGKSTDPTAGVAILLSQKMINRVMRRGWVGTRIVWVRIEGPVCNLFVIVTYIYHTRAEWSQVYKTQWDKKSLLITIRSHDCIIFMGGFDCQLRINAQGWAGKWYMTTRPDNEHGEEIIDLLFGHDLCSYSGHVFLAGEKGMGREREEEGV